MNNREPSPVMAKWLASKEPSVPEMLVALGQSGKNRANERLAETMQTLDALTDRLERVGLVPSGRGS